MTERYLENVRFLVIDDNMFIRTTVRLVLKTMGAREVQEASNGAEAFKLLSQFQPDIIIVDWEMEPVNGMEFVAKIRAGGDGPLSFVPLIMLSGHSEAVRVTAARDAGINEFVVKPFSAQGLFTRIQAVIDRPRPFIKVETYFGPDRRRKNMAFEGEDRRGKGPAPKAEGGDDAKAEEAAEAKEAAS